MLQPLVYSSIGFSAALVLIRFDNDSMQFDLTSFTAYKRTCIASNLFSVYLICLVVLRDYDLPVSRPSATKSATLTLTPSALTIYLCQRPSDIWPTVSAVIPTVCIEQSLLYPWFESISYSSTSSISACAHSYHMDDSTKTAWSKSLCFPFRSRCLERVCPRPTSSHIKFHCKLHSSHKQMQC